MCAICSSPSCRSISEHDFAPTYRVPDEKKEIVKSLHQAAAGAREVYLATDPDREGEAIAWR